MHELHPEADILDETAPTQGQLKVIIELIHQLADGGESDPDFSVLSEVKEYPDPAGGVIRVVKYPDARALNSVADVRFIDPSTGAYRLYGFFDNGPKGLDHTAIVGSDRHDDYQEEGWTGDANDYASLEDYLDDAPRSAVSDLLKLIRDVNLDEQVNGLTYRAASEIIGILERLVGSTQE